MIKSALLRRAVQGVAVAFVLLLAAPSLQSATAQGSRIIIAQGGGPTNLDPLKEQVGPMMNVWTLLFDGLTRQSAGGEVVPALATEWKAVSDTVWEFKLRSGVKFHNGEAFDADAVKFTLERILDPKRASQAKSRLQKLQKVEVVDPMTVRIHTNGPDPTVVAGLAWAFIVPPKYSQGHDESYLAQHPVGTGPFKFERWRQGEFIELAANTEYYSKRPKVSGVTIRQIPDDATRVASLMSGETHIIVQVPPDMIDALKKNPQASVASIGALMALVIEFDTVRGLLQDKRLRQAINYAIDKESLVRDLLGGQGTPLAGQILTPGAFGFNPALKAYPYDPERAKQLLKEAGHPDGIDLNLVTSVGRYIADREIAVAIAGQLAKVGIRVNVTPEEWGVFVKRLRGNQLGPMFQIGWYNYGDAAFALTHFTSTSTFGVYQRNTEFDELVQKGRTLTDQEERKKIYAKATKMMFEQAPAAFLLQLPAVYGVSSKVTGFTPRPDERWDLSDVEVKN
jgi:peptide/nickel transport system substrate-binding protein